MSQKTEHCDSITWVCVQKKLKEWQTDHRHTAPAGLSGSILFALVLQEHLGLNWSFRSIGVYTVCPGPSGASGSTLFA